MIRVLFFARLRETLDCQELDLDFTGTVTELKADLAKRGEVWHQAFHAEEVLVAINQVMSKNDECVKAGDEVAFFPPVTGG
ncbi:MAG TPA: molybdopterin converting factor subunit 1 [Porticoccaceae bacterium]|nr:molybdopterin converting factor subunit 1 [Porticoccaceae bacterium]